MYLVEDNTQSLLDKPEAQRAERTAPATIASPGGKWSNFPNSWIGHHGEECCDIAHEWLKAYDLAQLNGGDIHAGPRWIREHSSWGPTVWPIHWCEAVDAKVVDCGVHAALAHEVFLARGVEAFRAQFVQRCAPDTGHSWRHLWNEQGASDHWIDGELIYHEGNAIVVAGTVKLWDGSAGSWIKPGSNNGYGSLVALRIESPDQTLPRTVDLEGRTISLNKWVAVQP